ncbi:hypothetical protein [Streptomyces yaizuensis]|uniref:Uncharacterized protein n=1 Tax=Streptomyces yaizuensis TaxID=2989713 RepID=A0ABQ5NXY4_9ACTN|nr:hypothetical protein [Streptomyces sp. YSPA8]GLF95218.1 hypothetical protein SYYSPA8_12995 [Streptomyces sp. YSPA8]
MYACADLGFDDCLAGIGDEKLVVAMLHRGPQRVAESPRFGLGVPQDVPGEDSSAHERVMGAGFTCRLLV